MKPLTVTAPTDFHVLRVRSNISRFEKSENAFISAPPCPGTAVNTRGIRIAYNASRSIFGSQQSCGKVFTMSFKISSLSIAGIALCALTGCNTSDSHVTDPSGDPDAGRYHERSFSWDAPVGGLPKASALTGIASKQTTFASPEALGDAIVALEARLNDRNFTDSLWKPVDYTCDELDLALWNAYGTVRLGDSTVFDEAILKSRCRLSGSTDEAADAGTDSALLGKKSDWQWWHASEAVDRQYPYKMIGRSWDDYDIVVYKSTGGETQFEKNRSRFGITAWYDTDATRIGVRVYLFDCGMVGAQKYCYFGASRHSWYSNDDYVSTRDLALGEFTINTRGGFKVRPAKLKGSDAVISMHSVDHAGLLFRAISASGAGTNVLTEANVLLEFVTW
jgi:hypothetical protein